MPTCKTCEKLKPFRHFVSQRALVTKNCRGCRKKNAEKARSYYVENAERVKVIVKRWQKRKPEKWKAVRKEARTRYDRRNPEKKVAKARRYRKKHAAEGNARSANYRARKLQATPAWADLSAMADVYVLAKLQRDLTKQSFHVDHNVPLQSPFVCGLHCEANLSITSGGYNSRKKNVTWADMPDVSDPELLAMVERYARPDITP